MNFKARLMVRHGLCIAALCYAQASHADITSLLASNNATIKSTGPRTGTSGKTFLNVEGNGNGTNASFGVVDFTIPTGTTFTQAQSLSLTLTQSNAAFTLGGTLNFYITTDTTDSIEPTTSTLKYDATSLPDGINAQLSTKYLLGSGTFTQGNASTNPGGNANGTGTTDIYTFTLSGAAQTYLTSEINASSPIRLIIAPGDATVAATYAGYANTTAMTPGPKITLTDVVTATTPAPSSLLVIAMGAMPAVSVLRRRKASRN